MIESLILIEGKVKKEALMISLMNAKQLIIGNTLDLALSCMLLPIRLLTLEKPSLHLQRLQALLTF